MTAIGMAQLQVKQVSYAPQLFKAVRPEASNVHSVPVPWLLQEVSFDVFPGDRIAIVGASGSGKTTLLRLLNRLSEPTAGSIHLNGQAYPHVPVVQLRQQIVLMLQESKLLGMTVQQALAYPLSLRGLTKQMIQQRISEWMERLHLPQEWLDRTEHQLSVGQRQLVAIARALITQPQILLLDEPTSALDGRRSQQVLDVLIELSDRQQTTILMSNHQLDLAQKFSTRLLHFHQGKLLQDRTAQDVDWIALEHHLRTADLEQAEAWDEG